ncbi:hypothetical protein QEZ47_11780 [Aminobacter anthyllidis]|uniref:hypothetical protein n=1 Tax=Aminobacter anthyllidis TaxID=1035067 RepID=UPI002459087A|nr:hypothetical protein [Aminobacter anthyllidis]MDH4984833.1 hypothetical protein [Aminobacter anthyllidis]MDH4986202.1 hypothetical protein [Aminobacter anthyllidis]
MFFNQVQLHRELADLAFQCRNLRLVFSDDACLGLFIIKLAAIELCQPQLDEVRRDAVRALRITSSDDAVSDVLAKLQLERR